MSAPITIISSMATKQLLTELVAEYQQHRPHRPQPITVESIGGVDAAKRVQAGEPFDIVILAANAIAKLIEAGRAVAGSQVDLVRSGIAVAVRAGAPRVDISSEQAVKKAVSQARSVSYSTGPSGVFVAGLFERWGLTADIQPRLVEAKPGVPVGSLVARGEVELGFQQLSELMHLEGIQVLGPLPPEIQSITTFSGARLVTSTQADAVAALLAFMASSAALAIKRRNGMEEAPIPS